MDAPLLPGRHEPLPIDMHRSERREQPLSDRRLCEQRMRARPYVPHANKTVGGRGDDLVPVEVDAHHLLARAADRAAARLAAGPQILDAVHASRVKELHRVPVAGADKGVAPRAGEHGRRYVVRKRTRLARARRERTADDFAFSDINQLNMARPATHK